MRRATLVLSVLVLALGLPARVHSQGPSKPKAPTSAGPTESLSTVTEKLRAALGNCPFGCSITVEKLACIFRPGIWAKLPVTFRVSWSQARDGHARAFVMKDGRMSVVVDDKNARLLAGDMFTLDRGYAVTFKSADDAFAKGAPFYISDVGFDSASVVHFVVTSNPTMSVDYGMIAVQETGAGYNSGMASGFVSSDSLPRRVTTKLTTPLNPAKKTYLSIIDRNRQGCLASNDVLLDPRAAPKQ